MKCLFDKIILFFLIVHLNTAHYHSIRQQPDLNIRDPIRATLTQQYRQMLTEKQKTLTQGNKN
jgi:hypothetical protein